MRTAPAFSILDPEMKTTGGFQSKLRRKRIAAAVALARRPSDAHLRRRAHARRPSDAHARKHCRRRPWPPPPPMSTSPSPVSTIYTTVGLLVLLEFLQVYLAFLVIAFLVIVFLVSFLYLAFLVSFFS
jgi:hypothetical protein